MWKELIDGWSDWMRASGKPASTIYLRTYHVRRFARTYPNPFVLEVTDLASWMGAHDWSAETLRSYRASLRAFYVWAIAAGYTDTSPAAALPQVTPKRGMPRPTPTEIYEAAVKVADPRLRLMLRLGANAGLRRAEIAGVHTRDVFEDLDGWSLRVHGKGNRVRMVPLTPWLALQLRGAPEGWVFPSPKGGHLTPAHVGKLISRGMAAGWTAHTLRHRFGTRAMAVTRDLLVVQNLLGHVKPETTLIYTEIPAGAKREAVIAAAS